MINKLVSSLHELNRSINRKRLGIYQELFCVLIDVKFKWIIVSKSFKSILLNLHFLSSGRNKKTVIRWQLMAREKSFLAYTNICSNWHTSPITHHWAMFRLCNLSFILFMIPHKEGGKVKKFYVHHCNKKLSLLIRQKIE